ncbi:MAG: hypothetical protein ABSB14_19220, partial [Candidatus Sulfotelmatobacter sp.]
VFGFVDHAHASAAKFLDDAVVGDGLVDHGARRTGDASSYGCGEGQSTNVTRHSESCTIVCII